MTTFKILGLLFLGLVMVLILLIVLAPRQISTVSQIVINAPKQRVIEKVRLFGQYPEWSPWKETDPEQKHWVTGTDGELGAQFHWVGVKEKGKGYQELTGLTPQSITIQCHIQEPFQSEPTFKYSFTDLPEGTQVEYVFSTDMPIPMNVFGLLLRLKNNIQLTNDRALLNLKKVCE
jgi:hypothetical protein